MIKIVSIVNTHDDVWTIKYTLDGQHGGCIINDLHRPSDEEIYRHIKELEGIF